MTKMRGRKYPNRYETVSLDGEKVRYVKGGLHKTTGTPEGEKIPKSKWRAALSGSYGPKGQAQARLGLGLMGKTEKEFLG